MITAPLLNTELNPSQNTTLLTPSDDKGDNLNRYLDAIRIVMVNTTLPANIGSAARAMYTMGLTDLVVVDPKHPIDDSSRSHAAGALTVLDNTKVVDTLNNAIAHCHLVFAASSRNRHIPRPVVTPSQAGNIIKTFMDSLRQANLQTATQNYCQTDLSDTQPTIAILFGREDRGLTNDELARADYHIQIAANPEYPVLNVASAVQVIASFLYASLSHATAPSLNHKNQSNSDNHNIALYQRQQWDAAPITQLQHHHLQQRIIELMTTLSLIDNQTPDKLRDLPKRLTRLSSRLQLDQKEYELLNAIVAKVKLKI